MSNLITAILATVFIAITTPQTKDLLKYGDHTFSINEVPMLGLWDYSDGEPQLGKQKPPKFDLTGTGNWSGYDAVWLIRDSKLFLSSIQAKRDGKRIKDEEILLGREFPVLATWFSGRIHLFVGEYNSETERNESVIICQVDKGVVKNMSFEPTLEYTFEWNGLPSQRTEATK